MLQSTFAFRDFIAAATGCNVELGPMPRHPASAEQVHLWPWRMEPIAHSLNPHRDISRIEPPPVTIHVLVHAWDLSLLDRIRTAIYLAPILETTESRLEITEHALPAELLLNLFQAVGVPPQVCLSYALRATAAPQQAPGNVGLRGPAHTAFRTPDRT